jgi:hypothetical protein
VIRALRSLSRSLNRRWWSTFALVSLLLTAISLSMPVLTGPDEVSHTVKAAATVRGEFFGTVEPDPFRDHSRTRSPFIGFRLPGFFKAVYYYPGCLALTNSIPASCMGPFPRSLPGTYVVTSYHGRYSPLYYIPVGLPTLVALNEGGLYLMRIVGDLLCAAFLASALEAAFEVTRRDRAVLATLCCLTPAAVNLFTTVSSVSLEDASGLAFAAAVVRLLAEPATAGRKAYLRAGVAGFVLPFMRGASPFLELLIIGVAAAAFLGRDRLRQLDRRMVVASASIAGVGFALALAWIIRYKTLYLLGFSYHGPINYFEVFNETYRRILIYLYQQVAVHPYLSSPAVGALWVLASMAALVSFLLRAPTRVVVVTAASWAAYVWIPVVATLLTFRDNGLIWIGRYLLPIVGILYLPPAYSPDGEVGPASQAVASWLESQGTRRLILLAMAVAHLLFEYEVLRMYAVGLGGKALLEGPFPWQPPMGVYPTWALMWAVTVVVFVYVTRVGRITTGERVVLETRSALGAA